MRSTVSISRMNRPAWSCLLAACFFLGTSPRSQSSEIPCKPMSLFSDHMVLQRDMPVPVWGTAAPGDAIAIEFAGQRKSTAADATGKWQITLDPLEASSTPRQMLIHSAKTEKTCTLNDLLVGELWICSGQSNMEMPVGDGYRPDVYPGVVNFREEVATADHPKIRVFLVDHQTAARPAPDVPTPGWKVCSPESVSRFSAAGYFFARHLHEHLQVPVGMISAAWSSTTAEAWSSPAVLRSVPQTARLLDVLEARLAKADPAAKAPPIRREDPAALFHGMIAPLIPCAMRGVIWYQGESNARSASDYQKLFPALIRGWREAWAMPPPFRPGAPGGDFPFLFVQLAAYGGKPKQPVENGWANLREAQAMALKLPNTGMAVAIDIGDAKRIHPPNKQEVGRRLGLLARAIAYHEHIEASGPQYQSMRVEGDKIHLAFEYSGGGLMVKGGGSLTGFAIAGEDVKWHPAHAGIAGSEVIVTSPHAPRPLAVRYGWANNPDCNLLNKAGLPASPFRTDR